MVVMMMATFRSVQKGTEQLPNGGGIVDAGEEEGQTHHHSHTCFPTTCTSSSGGMGGGQEREQGLRWQKCLEENQGACA